MNTPHTMPADAVLAALRSRPGGLSSAEAAERLAVNGPNELRGAASVPAWKMLLGQFAEPMILILVAAAVLSLAMRNWTEGIAILAIVLMFGILGFLQERRAEQAMAALKRLACPTVRVRRDGGIAELPARDLVPGDVVLLEPGHAVPADLRFLDCTQCAIDESLLTGESEAARKSIDPLPAEPPLAPADRTNQAWMGTMVVRGRAEGVVVGTGMDTELGRIAGLIRDMDDTRTPLQRKLAQAGKHIAWVGAAAGAVVFVIGLLGGSGLATSLLTAVSLLVAVVPEGLPAVLTATLALGGRRMLRRQALIRRLPAVETLGSVTVICTDKTGTLTENRMRVMRIATASRDAAPEEAPDAESGPLFHVAALCNDAKPAAEGAGRLVGLPTETALLEAAMRHGIARDSLPARVAEHPFDSSRKRMATVHRGGTLFPDTPLVAAVKGAPDGVLPLCSRVLSGGRAVPLDDALRDRFRKAHAAMARDGLRVLGLAFRPLPADAAGWTADAVERDLVFCGLAGLMDPPRAEVAEALAAGHRAGIRTVMITGDHPLTAEAIARGLDLPGDGRPPVVATGADIAALSPDALADAASRTDVYARTTPEDKLRIVTALQARGEIVAMTGDGVNDAPALKKADIGVAMGRTGTDVAREASKMALLDDNYATLVAAVEEGRTIYDDLIRFLRYSFGGNLAKTLAMLLAPVAGLGAIALLPLHLLWLNLMTDGLLGLGIGLEAGEADVMRRPPRRPDAPVFDRATLWHVTWVGVAIAAGAMALALWSRRAGGPWQSVLFAAIGFGQIGQAWGLRSWTGRPFRFAPNPTLAAMTLLALVMQLVVLYVPVVANAFHLAPLAKEPLAATALFGLAVFVLLRAARAIDAGQSSRRMSAPSARNRASIRS